MYIVLIKYFNKVRQVAIYIFITLYGNINGINFQISKINVPLVIIKSKRFENPKLLHKFKSYKETLCFLHQMEGYYLACCNTF